MIKAVFFDFYNTLVDYDPPREQVQAAICGEVGIEVAAEAIRRAIPAADQFFYEENARLPSRKRSQAEKTDLYAQYETRLLKGAGVEVTKEVALQILAKFALRLRQSEVNLVLFDDVTPTLAQLKDRGLTLGLVTNVDQDITSICDRLGLFSYLNLLVTSQDVGAEKPDPAIFRAALKRAGVKASEAVHVGDQYHSDVLGARNAGIRPLLLDREDFYPQFTDCIRIRSLAGVVEHLL